MRNNLYILSLVTIIILSGCRAGPFLPWQMKYLDGPGDQGDKKLPPLYLDGWKDGCHTAVAANQNSFYRNFYSFKQDAIKAQNKVYYKGWRDAFDYCQRILYRYRHRGF